MKIITGATLVHPNGQQTNSTLLIEGNRIRSISQEAPGSLLLNQENVEVFSGAGCYLTPGLIELHFNGALCCNLNQSSISEIQTLLTQLPAFGITSVLFTVITAGLTDMMAAIHTLEEVIHYQNPYHCRPLGLHLEGPFIHPDYRGTHPHRDIRPIREEDLAILLSPHTKMITLAPEVSENLGYIQTLTRRGIQVSIGHTNATHAETIQAFQQGANSITHLYNAMRPFHHREPGPIGATFCENDVYVQFIGDGAHVHPAAIQMILQAKPLGKVLLTSDASPLAGLGDGSQGSFSQQTVVVRGNQVLNQEGGLAGSGKLVNDCLKNLLQWQLCNFPEAIQMASTNIAQFLQEDGIGRLEPGCLADLVLWNKETLAVETTFINGEVAYQRNASVARSA